MKKIISCTLSLSLVLVLANASFARPSGEVKASPLYQQSLEQSIAAMDGTVNPVSELDQSAGAVMPTSSGMCPAVRFTEYSTCAVTCQSTCANTCVNTCANTCYPGACQNYEYNGQVVGWSQLQNLYVYWGNTWFGGSCWDYYWTHGNFGGYLDAEVNGNPFPDLLSYAEFDLAGNYDFHKVDVSNATHSAVQAQVYEYIYAQGPFYYWGENDRNQGPDSPPAVNYLPAIIIYLP